MENFKISFYVIHMSISCSESKRGSVSSLSLCGGTIDMWCEWKETTITGGASMAWWFAYGGVKMETWLGGEESDQGWNDFFITMECGSRAVRGGWLVAVVWIQCFSFGMSGDATKWSFHKQIRFKARQVRRIFSEVTLNDCFERNLLTVSPIDPILLSLIL
jgi:hypothetical protein